MKIETQFKINGNTQKFNMILTMYDIIVKSTLAFDTKILFNIFGVTYVILMLHAQRANMSNSVACSNMIST